MSIYRLFNSRGVHIANFANGQLHSPSGHNIGHYLKQHGIFIDMHGRYIGEVVSEKRLLCRSNSSHSSRNYGVYGNFGNIGNHGNPGNYETIAMPAGYADISL